MTKWPLVWSACLPVVPVGPAASGLDSPREAVQEVARSIQVTVRQAAEDSVRQWKGHLLKTVGDPERQERGLESFLEDTVKL